MKVEHEGRELLSCSADGGADLASSSSSAGGGRCRRVRKVKTARW